MLRRVRNCRCYYYCYYSCIPNLKSLAQVDFEIFNVKCNAMVDVTLIRPLNKSSRSFILVPINFSYTTSYRFNSNFCSRTQRLATIHNVTDDDRRRTDASLQHELHNSNFNRFLNDLPSVTDRWTDRRRATRDIFLYGRPQNQHRTNCV